MTAPATPAALADEDLAELRRLAEQAIQWDPPWDLVVYDLQPAAKDWVLATHPEKVLALLDAAARVAALEQRVRTAEDGLAQARDRLETAWDRMPFGVPEAFVQTIYFGLEEANKACEQLGLIGALSPESSS